MGLRVVSLVLFFFLTNCATTSADPTSDEALGPTIDDLLQQVQLALEQVQLHPLVRTKLPDLDRVELILNAGFDKNGKLKLNLFFFQVGGGASASESQEIKLTLKPPTADPDKASPISASDTAANRLKDLIIAAAEGVAKAGDREPPLETRGLQIALKFGVKKEGSIGAEFTIAPITVEAGGGVNTSQIQTITLAFE